MRELDAEPVEILDNDTDGNVEAMPENAESLVRLAVKTRNLITHYTAELDRIEKALDERLQDAGYRCVSNVRGDQ